MVSTDSQRAGNEIEITRHGCTVARLVPATGPNTLRGQFAGVASSVADDELLFTTSANRETD